MIIDVFNLVVDTVKKIGKVGIGDIAKSIFFSLPQVIDDISDFFGSDDKEKIRAVANSVNQFTGTDSGAIDVIRDMPQEVEEDLFYHLSEMIYILGCYAAGVEGFRTTNDKGFEADTASLLAAVESNVLKNLGPEKPGGGPDDGPGRPGNGSSPPVLESLLDQLSQEKERLQDIQDDFQKYTRREQIVILTDFLGRLYEAVRLIEAKR